MLNCLSLMHGYTGITEMSNTLDADHLMSRAKETANLDNFGDLIFVEPLREHLAAAARCVTFSKTGLENFTSGIVNELVNRLRLARDLKHHPKILDEDVSDPIVITGLPRTGSTKLQRMMSADPANQPLLFWKILNFAPFPEAVPSRPDPRIDVAKAACDYTATSHPEIMKIHPSYYDQPEEEAFLVGASYEQIVNTMTVGEPEYHSYILSRPRENAYVFLRTVLKYLQWQAGGKHGPWILKAPVHLGNIDIVLSLFPKATIVQTHREVTTVFASLCHLIEVSSELRGERLDPLQVGRDQLRIWGEEWARNRTIRARLCSDTKFVDIDYQEIKNDPFAVLERIYALAGREFSEAGRTAMEGWQTTNRKDRHGKHEYRLEDYGVTRAQVEVTFS